MTSRRDGGEGAKAHEEAETADLRPAEPQAPTPEVEPQLPPSRPRTNLTSDGHRVAPDPSVGDVVGGYRLEALLGKGGAGSVFKAVGSDGGAVALKVLAAAKVKRARVVQRFFDEVRAASLVQHEGLIRVLDFVEEEDPRRLAYAMEFVEGEMLRARLKRETALDLRLAIQVGIQICEALAALHRGGIVHRDLKPENILLAEVAGAAPRVKLLDFGVVKFLPVDRTAGMPTSEEKPGTFVGTPRYMAPEQAAGAPVDGRADLFSLGVLLFEMITGRCPHEGDSLRDVVLAKLKGAPRITVNPEKEILPQELTDVVDACLQLKPSLRPDDARKVASDLRAAEMVLFAVGPIRFGDGGETVRAPSEVRPSATPVRPPTITRASGLPRPAIEERGPRSDPHLDPRDPAGPGPADSAPPARDPMSSQAERAAGRSPAERGGTAPAARDPMDRRLVMVLLGLAMVAAALLIALVAQRAVRDSSAAWRPPSDQPPAEVEFQDPARTTTSTSR
ncbi:MAG: serine/threonine protein kinase [Myxococcales bacterium]|nr:serine/threonine protein kinase [Myxococcales bacterium]MCB9645748.1 serine/threonine protein kinase [Deltaproteobacteria bacterium]